MPHTVRVDKSMTIWEGHVTWMGKMEVCTEFMWGNFLESGHLKDQAGDGY